MDFYSVNSDNSLHDVSGQPIGPIFKGQDPKTNHSCSIF